MGTKVFRWVLLVLLTASAGLVHASSSYKPYKSAKAPVKKVAAKPKAKKVTALIPFLVYTPEQRAPYATLIKLAAYAYDVEVSLVHAVISAESGYNPGAKSRVGAVGLMQLMPKTAERYGVTDINDPEQNIAAGTRYLRDLMRMFNNNMPLVIAAYNAGEGAVRRYGDRIPPYKETTHYVPKVMNFYKAYTGFIHPHQPQRLDAAATSL